MAYCNATLFLLSPAPGGPEEKVAGLYPAGRQTLARHNTRLDSGVDLPAPEDVVVGPGEVVKVNLGVRAVCLRLHDPPQYVWGAPPGAVLSMDPVGLPWAYRLVPRSSISKTPLMLANSEGIIDLGYRGPLIAAVRNVSSEAYVIKAGAALFQLVSADLAPPEYEVLAADDPRTAEYFGAGATERGAGGFGSTGAAGSAAAKPKDP
jgi:dUTP pyrophosphatase